jgi:hypothetical protein
VNWTAFVAVATALGVLTACVGTVLAVRTNRREARAAEAQARAAETQRQKDHEDELRARYDAGFADGVAHAEPAAALLRYQRDDAWRERDNERADRVDAHRRIQELEDQLRPRPGKG